MKFAQNNNLTFSFGMNEYTCLFSTWEYPSNQFSWYRLSRWISKPFHFSTLLSWPIGRGIKKPIICNMKFKFEMDSISYIANIVYPSWHSTPKSEVGTMLLRIVGDSTQLRLLRAPLQTLQYYIFDRKIMLFTRGRVIPVVNSFLYFFLIILYFPAVFFILYGLIKKSIL